VHRGTETSETKRKDKKLAPVKITGGNGDDILTLFELR
jgi:hypothetical protein